MRTLTYQNKEYREIPQFPNYFVSSDGQLVSLARNKKRVWPKLQEKAANGYMRASFRVNGRNIKRPVHRMVLLTWGGLPTEGRTQVNHKNGIKTDNRLENLEWATHAENQAHWRKYLHEQVRGEYVRASKLKPSDVHRIRSASQFLSTYELARAFGVNRSSVSSVISRRTWKHI